MGHEQLGIIARWGPVLPLALPLAWPLVIPALAGIVYLASAGAPNSYVIVNCATLVAGLGLIVSTRLPQAKLTRLVIAGVLLAILALPLAIGAAVDEVTRWISLGGFTLHSGFLAAPLLVRISASEERAGPWIVLLAILLAFTQPDFATCLALSFGALAAAICNRQGAMLAVCALGFSASLGASFAVNLPPQPYVERVLPELWASSPIAAVSLGLALCAGGAALVLLRQMPEAARWAVLATMTGFVAAAALGDYPYPVIGYGAASLLGFAMALITPAAKGD